MQRSDVIHKIRLDLRYIKDHINQVSEVLQSATLMSDSGVYTLPSLSGNDIAQELAHIEPVMLTGQAALYQFATHSINFILREKHPGVMAHRLPGCLCFKTEHESELRERITLVNRLKSEFDQFIQLHAGNNTDERFETVSQAVPFLIRKAAARNVLMAPSNTFSVSFSWSHSTSRSAVKPRSYWYEKLDRTLVATQSDVNAEGWAQAIAQEKRALANANDTELFQVIRPLRVTPINNIKFNRVADGTHRKTTMVAHSPILVFNDEPKISTMKPYHGARIKKREVEPIIERLHLYKAKS
ncbi:DNA replication terminus site-binding protein [Pseudoalteromonas luteoviolacea]|uniref:DNA replication terminus site-binding protein n=1 Tax=Pseudoalteromonas luteoviolacea TaxID=43657 RepID=UPI001153E73A|nr:DNA replication terminus site-binding protein [Pseudoalteromonas luteoviolacea]TQF66187.1 hypothetical protein FLM44_25530 [Pseudoalteromonas luteoviolacea]